MQLTIAIGDPGICQSVCHMASTCKRGRTDQGPACGSDSLEPKNRVREGDSQLVDKSTRQGIGWG